MPLQPAEQPISLEELGVKQDIKVEVIDGELTLEQEQELAEIAAQTSDTALQVEERRIISLVETIDATEEQKAELRHRIRLLFFSTTGVTILTMLVTIDSIAHPLFESQAQMPPMVYIAMGTIMSYLFSAGILKFNGYGDAKRKLQETEERLMEFAELMEITGDTPKEILQNTIATGKSHERTLRVKNLSLELAQNKKKRVQDNINNEE
ncbi:hypothetical protein KBD71_05350 [Candidatus Woesebacteria bacterium]|nr:hypothetical protein [Candidatus Woesebacteria bacterium]